MRLYHVLSPVRAARVRYEPGEFVELDEADGDALAERGIVEAAEADFSGYVDDRPPAPPPPAAKAALPSKTELAKFNKQELLDQAKAEGVQVVEGATNKVILGAILAARPQG